MCEQCARALIKYGRVKCPFDNKSFDYVSIDQMGKNFSLLDLIDADKPKELEVDERLCEVHHGKKAKFYCEDEKIFACSDCLLEKHIGHKIVPSKTIILGEVVQDTLTSTVDVVKKLQEMSVEHQNKINSSHQESKALIELVRD